MLLMLPFERSFIFRIGKEELEWNQNNWSNLWTHPKKKNGENGTPISVQDTPKMKLEIARDMQASVSAKKLNENLSKLSSADNPQCKQHTSRSDVTEPNPFLCKHKTCLELASAHVNHGGGPLLYAMLHPSSLHACRVDWSCLSPWRADCGGACNRDGAHGLHSLMGLSHTHHGCTWSKLYGTKFHRPPP